jgi:hypothetical protein
MKIITSTLKYFICEFFIIFSFIFLINNYIGNVDKTINADGIGYYDYLPSIFIYHDLLRKNNSILEDSNLYKRINSTGLYVDFNNFKVNKCPCGTALLQLPFFTYTYFTTNLNEDINDGYQKPFQRTVFYSAIFYLFLSILFLKKILILYNIKNYIIFVCQLLLVLATSVTHYSNFDAAFSHVYSLFAITAFVYFIKSYLQNKRITHFVLGCLFLGLIFILRQPNILIVLFIPFLAGSIENIKIGITTLFANKRSLVLGILLFLGISAIQLILWYMQTGHFFVNTYQGESFNFLDPHFRSILFSYKKGLFIYTPVLLITLFSLIWFCYKKYFYLLVTWVSFFLILTYVLSSWWSWFYGCSYGLRAYIDYYVIFFIPFALMLDRINTVARLIIIIITLPSIPMNIIQTYQYKEFILHWIDMDKEKYWKVFLKTNDRFKGLVWKTNHDPNLYSTVYEINVGDIFIPKNTVNVVYKINSLMIPDFNKVSIIQVFIDNDYIEDGDTQIILSINNSSNTHNYYLHKRYLIHFHEKNFNDFQTGFFNFEFNPISDFQEKIISLEVKTTNQNEFLKNVKLLFLCKNNSTNE